MTVDSKDVLAKLQREPAPLSFAKLKKAYVSKKTGVTEADLRLALAGDEIFAWPKNRYWHLDPVAQLDAEILAHCTKKALKKTEIKVKGRNVKEVGAALERLTADKKLLKYPALAGAVPLWVTSEAPQAYWAYVEEFVAAKLKKAGIEEIGLEERIWEILPKLEPERDVPVSISNVRRSLRLTEADKRRFDEAVLHMRERRLIHLTQHDHPLGLSAGERDLLTDGKDGRYYVAITRREQ